MNKLILLILCTALMSCSLDKESTALDDRTQKLYKKMMGESVMTDWSCDDVWKVCRYVKVYKDENTINLRLDEEGNVSLHYTNKGTVVTLGKAKSKEYADDFSFIYASYMNCTKSKAFEYLGEK
jgi:hypothetical protein